MNRSFMLIFWKEKCHCLLVPRRFHIFLANFIRQLNRSCHACKGSLILVFLFFLECYMEIPRFNINDDLAISKRCRNGNIDIQPSIFFSDMYGRLHTFKLELIRF